MESSSSIKLFDNFKILDGYHCITNSLAKIYNFYHAPLSEEMLLGLGAGLGFIYWHQKGTMPFLGGRSSMKNYYTDLGKRTGVVIQEHTTSSQVKAEKELLIMLNENQPVMVAGDMGFLPCFDFGSEYHFGGHTFVICGYDGADKVLVTDIDPKAAYLKKGFVYEMSLEQLAKARNSKFKPFPPRNAYYTFNFANFRVPTSENIQSAVSQVVDSMLNPPIKNVGVKGIHTAADAILNWPKLFSEDELRSNLFMIYVFIHIGGTGSGIFRYMYSRFLEETAEITKNPLYQQSAQMFKRCGDLWTDLALMLKDAPGVRKLDPLVKDTSLKLKKIADEENKVFSFLKEMVG